MKKVRRKPHVRLRTVVLMEGKEKNYWSFQQLRKKRGVKSANLAPVQGIQLRNGTWTANGPNLLTPKGASLCSGMKVQLLERGPFLTRAKVTYSFKAIQAALDSLAPQGYDKPNTIYFPPGTYRITKTLSWKKLYSKRLLGHGRETRILWDGVGPGTKEPSVMFHSNGATAGVVFEGLIWDGAGKAMIGVNHCSTTHYESHVIHRNSAYINLAIGIASSWSPWFEYKNATAMVTYNDVSGYGMFRNLGTNDRVYLQMFAGLLDFDSCQRGTILVEQFLPGRHPNAKRTDTPMRVRGKDQSIPKDGFLGFMTFFNAGNPYDMIIEDSQSLVISDYYTEQTKRVIKLEGDPDDTPGRVTVLCHKFHGEYFADLVQVRNYRGAFFLSANPLAQIPAEDGDGRTMKNKVKFVPFIFSHRGENPIDIMLVSCSYGGCGRKGDFQPVIQKEKGANFIMANDVAQGVAQIPWHSELSLEDKVKISRALDQLRHLGEVDMEFKNIK